SGRFVAINCAAFPDTLLESELFGYERGAFTGAVHDRVGKIELSSGGTLFLDEIESISLNMQLKLLRVLEEREVEKLGSNRRIKVNLRIICATNMDLAAAVAEGRMREDFYYRINVVPMRIPPLRERVEDIPLLVGEFLRNSEMAREKGINRLSNKALSQLMSYQWPGNVRELGNVVERAILRTSGAVIREADLPGRARPPQRRSAGAPEPRPRGGQWQRTAARWIRRRGAAQGVPPPGGARLSRPRPAQVSRRHQPVREACARRRRDPAPQDEAPW